MKPDLRRVPQSGGERALGRYRTSARFMLGIGHRVPAISGNCNYRKQWKQGKLQENQQVESETWFSICQYAQYSKHIGPLSANHGPLIAAQCIGPIGRGSRIMGRISRPMPKCIRDGISCACQARFSELDGRLCRAIVLSALASFKQRYTMDYIYYV